MSPVPISGLQIYGSGDEIKIIEGWLQKICSRVKVDSSTGIVSITPRTGNASPEDIECDCLQSLINAGDHPGGRRTIIHPLPSSDKPVPGSGKIRANGQDATIGSMGGGACVPRDVNGSEQKPDGTAGTGADGAAGSTVDVYIDMSNNATKDTPAKGYDQDDLDNPNVKDENPLFVILAHELTSGHASWCVKGREFSDRNMAEARAKMSENNIRDMYGYRHRKVRDG